jgi:hypothetical protein
VRHDDWETRRLTIYGLWERSDECSLVQAWSTVKTSQAEHGTCRILGFAGAGWQGLVGHYMMSIYE